MKVLSKINRKSLLVFLCVIHLFAISSCDFPVYYYFQSYVYGYDIYDNMELIPAYYEGSKEIAGIGIYPQRVSFVNLEDDLPKRKLYDDLCVANGDLTYDREVGLRPWEYYDHIAISPNITELDITSDKDFDTNHPAGASLADLVKVTYISYGPYVRNGYKGPTPEKETTKLLSQMQREDFFLCSADEIRKYDYPKFCGSSIVLTFVKTPANPGETHTFTITIQTEEKTFIKEFAMTF